jgi:uncharacterized membrane protein YbhN (UPF0104 family)
MTASGSRRSRLRELLHVFGAHHLEQQARHVAFFLLVGAAVSVGAGVAVAWVAGFDAVAAALRHPTAAWFPFALAGAGASHFGYVLAYREIAAVDEGTPIGALRAGALVATGFGIFVPRGGFTLDLEALRDLGVPQDEARVRVLGLGSLEYLVLSTGACVCSFLLLARHSGAEQAVTLSWAIGVPAGTALALAALSARGVLYRSRRLEPLLRPALDALEVLGKILVRPRRHGLRALAGMSLYWAGEVFVLWACLAAFDVRTPSVAATVVGYATGYALTRRTLPLAGAGAVELALPFALSWVGFGLAPAVLATFAYRVFNVWLPVAPALAGLAALQRRPPQPGRGSVPDAEVGGDDRDAEPVVDPRRRRDVDG